MTIADEVASLDAIGQRELVQRGDVTTVELVEAAIDRIETSNPTLNAVITPTFDRALARLEHGVSGPFAGVPFLLKDLALELEGVRCCEGSRFTRDHVSKYTSEAVRRMEDAGLVILGKTNTPEFGMVPTTEPERFGPTRNPWDTTRSTSGSSGGAAAAVASRMVPMAHADDLGGSIRYPAAVCGLFGLKPTRGRITYAPQYGDVASGWASEFAVTCSVRDAAALLDALAGPSAGDPYTAPPPARPYAHEVTAEPGRLRIGWTARTADGSPGHPDCVGALDATLASLADLGHEIVETELPPFDDVTGAAIGTVFNAATAWIVGYWTRELGRLPEPGELEPLTQCYWEMGREVRAGDYLLAIEALQGLSRRIAASFDAHDVFVNPTMSEPPALIGEITSTVDDPMRALVRGGRTVAYSGVIANFTGQPAMSVPAGENDDGLPMGVHVLGRFGDEATLLRLASQLEQARPWANGAPPP